MKIKLFFKKHIKKFFVCIMTFLFCFSLVLSVSAQTLQYVMFEEYRSNVVDSYWSVNEESDSYYLKYLVSSRDSRNNRFTATLLDNSSSSYDWLHRFDLVVRFNSNFELFEGDTITFKFDLSANCEFVRDQITKEVAFYYLNTFTVVFTNGQSFVWKAPYHLIEAYEVTDQRFEVFMGTLTEYKGSISEMRWSFNLKDPIQFRSYDVSDLRNPYFNVWFNNSLITQIERDKATNPTYTPPNSSTLDDALGLEDTLLDEVGGDLYKLSELLGSDVFYNNSIRNSFLSFTSIFDGLFSRDNNFSLIVGYLLQVSVALGLSGFVLNIVVGIISHFSSHSRDGTNNPKGGGK